VLPSDDAYVRADFYIVPNRDQPTIENGKAKAMRVSQLFSQRRRYTLTESWHRSSPPH
jgi:hypothetical protein